MLNVFGWAIPVYKVKDLVKEGAYGLYDDTAKYIMIDDGLNSELTEHSIIHEMFHATLDRLHCQVQLDEKFVEVIVENLSVALMENFKVSPKN